jgi:ribosomal protein S8
MIGVMNSSVKAGLQSCEVPANKITINTLRLLRNQGFIWGFNFVSPRKRESRLYPRVRIHFKYIDINTPILKAIRVFKNTRSNFTILQHNKLFKILAQNKLYLLTTPKGLIVSSIEQLYNEKVKSQKTRYGGKLLAELFI